MTATFETYKPRPIHFFELFQKHEWSVKVYTISNKSRFDSLGILEKARELLPEWLLAAAESKLAVYKKAFLIVHEGREGVWILFSWWTGGEMLRTKVFFAAYEHPIVIKSSPYATNALLCVWELEVFAHERNAWIQHVLVENPNYKAYLKDVL